MVFKLVNSGNKGKWSQRSNKPMRWALQSLPQLTAQIKISKLQNEAGRPRQLRVPLSWGDGARCSRKLQFTEQSTREERSAQKNSSRDLQRATLECLADYLSENACKKMTWDEGEEYLNGIDRRLPRNNPCSVRQSSQKGIDSVWGQLVLDRALLWSHQTKIKSMTWKNQTVFK